MYIVPDVVMFLYIFVPASLPSLAVGVVDGFARTPRRTAWGVLLKVVASLLVVALGLFITLIGAFFLAFTESNLNADIVPLPLGMYLGALLDVCCQVHAHNSLMRP